MTQDSLRAQIGVVTQDTSLLHRSIRENIAYGRPGRPTRQIATRRAAPSALGLHRRARRQRGPHGLDAHVGERGVKLSGGQRQRIAIARMFLKDAPILVLDEATSALDSEVEAAIQEHLFHLMRGKTVIAIAHRLSTIARWTGSSCSIKGRSLKRPAQGAGRQKRPLRRLWARQSGGFIAGEGVAAE